MADATNKWGTYSSFTITLASLANGSARQSTALDVTAIAKVQDINVWVKTKGPGSGSPAGPLRLYCAGSPDNTLWPDTLGATDAAWTPDSPPNVPVMGDCNMDNNAQSTIAGPFSVLEALGLARLPKYVVIGALNSTGVALSSTAGDHAITYQPVYDNIA